MEAADLQAASEAGFVGAFFGEHEAGAPAAAGDMIEVADCAADLGEYNEDALKQRGLDGRSQCGPAGLLLRAIPFALLRPLDRPRVRSDAYHVAKLGAADDITAIAAIAAAMLAADLLRFDLSTSLMRVRQSLIEDAPTVLLDALRVPESSDSIVSDEQAIPALSLAISALSQCTGIVQCVAHVSGQRRAAKSLAGVLAGIRDCYDNTSSDFVQSVPHHQRAVDVARSLAEHSLTQSAHSAASSARER